MDSAPQSSSYVSRERYPIWMILKMAVQTVKESSEAEIINVSFGLSYIAILFYSVYAVIKTAVKLFPRSSAENCLIIRFMLWSFIQP